MCEDGTVARKSPEFLDFLNENIRDLGDSGIRIQPERVSQERTLARLAVVLLPLVLSAPWRQISNVICDGGRPFGAHKPYDNEAFPRPNQKKEKRVDLQ